MKIKKADDKPMVIHTKEKPELHTKSAPQTKIKGRYILTVSRGPKTADSQMKQEFTNKKKDNRVLSYTSRKERNLKKSDISEDLQREDRLRNQHIKTKASKEAAIKKKPDMKESGNGKKSDAIKAVGAAGARTALNEMEGGSEVYKSAQIVSVLASPLNSAGDSGRRLYRHVVARQEAEKRIKKVDIVTKYGKKAANNTAMSGAKAAVKDTTKKTAKEATKKAAKETSKKIAKETAKTTVKVSAQAAGTAAGTAITGAGGVVIGAAAGKAVGKKMEKQDLKNSTRNRMIQLFVSQLRQEENQDNIVKALKDIVAMRFHIIIKKIVTYIGLFLAGVFALVALVALPIIAVITVIYNSPFAIFFPSITSGKTTQEVLSAYVAEFNRDVNREAGQYSGYDWSEKIYMDYEGAGTPDNYYDIIAVYMVKYGVGDTATDMTDKAKANLKRVFDDMCSYSISSGTKTEVDEDGNEITYRIKYVNVSLKSYHDMISRYGFNEKEVELLLEIMKPENLALIGYTGGGGDSGQTISDGQYQAIVDAVSDANGRRVVEFVLSKVGYPYSQAYRDSGNYYDCSSLAYYAWRRAGVSIMYEGSNTAASEGKYCYDKNYLVNYSEMQPGDLIFYSYAKNGRFMNISHVAVYVGNGMVVEAANERLGVVYRAVQSRNAIVFIGRPR